MAYKEKRYCAFCKNLRTYYMKKHISFMDFVVCALASMAAMALVWQDFNIKVFYFFVFAIVCCEIMVRLRWRMKMICDICGFDPILYKRNPQGAADLVKAFLEKRKTDPQMLLKPYPKLTTLKKRAVRHGVAPLKRDIQNSGANSGVKAPAKPSENAMKA